MLRFPSYWKSLICHDWRINCKLIAYNSMNEFLPGAEFGLSSSINWLFSSLRMENQIFFILISLSLVEDQIIWRRRKSLDFQNGWKIKYLKKILYRYHLLRIKLFEEKLEEWNRNYNTNNNEESIKISRFKFWYEEILK